jgi:hypothetical protein
MKMFGRVLVLRAVAAADVAAGHALAQMDPAIAERQTPSHTFERVKN